jgi:hypothetical protein
LTSLPAFWFDFITGASQDLTGFPEPVRSQQTQQVFRTCQVFSPSNLGIIAYARMIDLLLFGQLE